MQRQLKQRLLIERNGRIALPIVSLYTATTASLAISNDLIYIYSWWTKSKMKSEVQVLWRNSKATEIQIARKMPHREAWTKLSWMCNLRPLVLSIIMTSNNSQSRCSNPSPSDRPWTRQDCLPSPPRSGTALAKILQRCAHPCAKRLASNLWTPLSARLSTQRRPWCYHLSSSKQIASSRSRGLNQTKSHSCSRDHSAQRSSRNYSNRPPSSNHPNSSRMQRQTIQFYHP